MQPLTEHVGIKGSVTVTKSTKEPIIKDDGSIYIPPESLVDEKQIKNTIVYTGRAIVAALMADATALTTDKITKFAMGYTGLPDPQPAPSPQDTFADLHIIGEMLPINQISTPSSVSRMFTIVVQPGVNTSDWNELALITNNNVLFSRLTTSTQTKEPDVFLTFRWVIVF